MAMYHLKVSVGSRGGGQSARAKSDYIEREGRYAKDSEELEYRESGNMPEWAEDSPRSYWEAADEHERANGSLYREVEFALPRELDVEQRQTLARSFAQELTGPERLPYTLAVHRGGSDGGNPHAHLMISERGLDGHDRDAEQWFRRANTKAPEKGGARKTRSMMSKEWLEQTREAWAQRANRALDRAGRGERIDHRSLAAQRDEAHRNGDKERATQLNREPGVHLGPQVYDWSGEKHPDSTVKQRDADVDRYNRGLERDRGGIDGDIERTERWYGGIKKELRRIVSEIRDTAARIEAWRNPPKAPQQEWPGPDIGF